MKKPRRLKVLADGTDEQLRASFLRAVSESKAQKQLQQAHRDDGYNRMFAAQKEWFAEMGFEAWLCERHSFEEQEFFDRFGFNTYAFHIQSALREAGFGLERNPDVVVWTREVEP